MTLCPFGTHSISCLKTSCDSFTKPYDLAVIVLTTIKNPLIDMEMDSEYDVHADQELNSHAGRSQTLPANAVQRDARDDVAIATRASSPMSAMSSQQDECRSAIEPFDAELLQSYVPLGSITFPYMYPKLTDDWIETDHLPDALPEDHPLFQSLDRLVSARWIRLFSGRNRRNGSLGTVRIYFLPDDVLRGRIPRYDRKIRLALKTLLRDIDRSPGGWDGWKTVEDPALLYQSHSSEDDSLFYIFNTLESPRPDPARISDVYARDAVMELMEGSASSPISGLKTKLYPYQKRSAAVMIEREANPRLTLDPRIEVFCGPTGATIYYDRQATFVIIHKREYDQARGGILAETMGYGKTLICLTAILATKGHSPRIPPEYSEGLQPVRSQVGSLAQMVAATMARNSVPWKAHFGELARQGEDHEGCMNVLRENACYYNIPDRQTGRRQAIESSWERLFLSSLTLIVVPPNLMTQWRQEIGHHVEGDSLEVLVVDKDNTEIPEVRELLRYDVILITTVQLVKEIMFNDAAKKKPSGFAYAIRSGSPRRHKCTCSSDPFTCDLHVSRSPLRDIHFLRLIVDEGHQFGSSGTGNQLLNCIYNLHVERKWIVSGTPSPGLMGVEVDIAIAVDAERKSNQETLIRRRKELSLDQERKDITRLGNIVKDFLGVQPWANRKTAEMEAASWHDYVMPSREGVRKPQSLREVLQGLVVRHRIEDIELDRPLPPLHNRVVFLEPCYFDKLSINLFLFLLATNAVTSERADGDYMFHPKNRLQLDTVIKNLRQSGFYVSPFQDVLLLHGVCYELYENFQKAGNRYLK
jgi:hypothetical protein